MNKYICLAGGLLFLYGCGNEHSPAPRRNLPPAKVRTEEVRTAEMAASEEVMATIRPKVEAVIAAQITGPIESITAELGDTVKKGDPLARISETEIRAKLRQAEAQLAQAESAYRREQKLFAQNASTESAVEAAEARYKVARGMAEEMNTVLGYTSIKAPFAGVVTQKHVSQGDLAAPGKPLLLLEDPAVLQAEAEVPEALCQYVQAGQRIEVRVGSAGLSLNGTVSEISPSADPVSRTFLTKIDLPQNERLRSGQFARAVIPARKIKTLCVPASAVTMFGQMERVFVASEGRAELRLVKTGMRCEDRVEILSGLSAGERVVTAGTDRLAEGQPLEIQP